jgi:ABC-type Fe3+-citrate transport system substrate-binding protein
MGYPKEVPEKADRLPLEAIVHIEQYHDYSDNQIKELYSHKESLEESKMFVEQNGKQNLAQVYAEIRYKTEDSQFFSGKLLEMLKEQGFTFVH